MFVESLSSSDLRSATRELVRTSHGVDAALLVHLGEIDERKLYLDWAFSSMFAFCVGELGLSEDVACNRIDLARAARSMPVILEALRSGRVHLAGLRLLAPHLTTQNQEEVLAEAAGKSKRQIGQEGAIRDGSKSATGSRRTSGRIVFASRPERDQTRGRRARRRPLHVHRRAWRQVQ